MSVCPSCGETFDEVVLHWTLSSTCEHPPLDQQQKELLKGLVMGDGSLSNRSKGRNARLRVQSTNERWLRWLRAQFEAFATEVTLAESGDEAGLRARKYPEFDDSGGDWVYNDIYQLDIRSHPYLTRMRERWYPSGQIRYPDDLALTPVAAKAWYCSDGGLSWSDREHAHAAFGTHNEADRPEYLCDLFREHGFGPAWSEPLIRFTTAETTELLDWMGVAPAGFEYKWEVRSRDRYDRMKAVVTA